MADVKSEVKTQCETVKKTFAQVLNVPLGMQATAVPDLRGIMRDTLTEQKQQSEDTERRAKNIIIVYGIKEITTDTEKAQTDATTSAFINDLCDYLECQVGHTQYRLGRIDENATSHQRPIKVIFNSVTDKDKVMLSLRKLRVLRRTYGREGAGTGKGGRGASFIAKRTGRKVHSCRPGLPKKRTAHRSGDKATRSRTVEP